MKKRKVHGIEARSTTASFPLKGQVNKHTTVNWVGICNKNAAGEE